MIDLNDVAELVAANERLHLLLDKSQAVMAEQMALIRKMAAEIDRQGELNKQATAVLEFLFLCLCSLAKNGR